MRFVRPQIEQVESSSLVKDHNAGPQFPGFRIADRLCCAFVHPFAFLPYPTGPWRRSQKSSLVVHVRCARVSYKTKDQKQSQSYFRPETFKHIFSRFGSIQNRYYDCSDLPVSLHHKSVRIVTQRIVILRENTIVMLRLYIYRNFYY
jgi:hypothetical protein